jgi:hypothetical protein
VLYVSRSLAPGEELCAITRLPARASLPREINVLGAPGEAETIAVEGVAEGAGYLPRAWAKLEIDRLLADDAAKHKDTIIALSKAMYVMTPFTALLVLENDELYTQYKVDRSRQDHWALYHAPKKIPVVYEPDPDQPDPKAKAGQRLPAKQVLQTILVRGPLTVLRSAAYYEPDEEGEEETEEPSARRGFKLNGETASRHDMGRFFTKLNMAGMPAMKIGPIGLTPPGVSTPDLNIAVKNSSFEFTLARFDVKALPLRPVGELLMPIKTSGKLRVEQLRLNAMMSLYSSGSMSGQDFFVSRELAESLLVRHWKMRDEKYARLVLSPGVAHTIPEQSESRSPLIYERPKYSGEDRLFYDLVAYCPGLNTSQAGVDAVLEAEALPDRHNKRGTIDAGARALIEKSRPAAWQALTLLGENRPPARRQGQGAGHAQGQALRGRRPGYRSRHPPARRA